jgi:hypothetical protein
MTEPKFTKGPRYYSAAEIDLLRHQLQEGVKLADKEWKKRGVGLNLRLKASAAAELERKDPNNPVLAKARGETPRTAANTGDR